MNGCVITREQCEQAALLQPAALAIAAFSRDDRVTSTFLQLIGKNEDRVPFKAILALEEMGPSASSGVPAFTRWLDDSGLRRDALRILARIGRAAKPAMPRIRKLLGSEDDHTRILAARAVWCVDRDSTTSIAVLQEVLAERHGFADYRYLEVAVCTLAEMRGSARRCVPHIRKFLAVEDHLTRMIVRGALAAIEDDPESIKQLLEVIRKPEADTYQDWHQQWALEILANKPAHQGEVIRCVDDSLVNQRGLARSVTVQVVRKLAIPVSHQLRLLVAATADPSPWVRQLAVHEIGKLKKHGRSAIPRLHTMLNDPAEFVQWQAAGAINMIRQDL